MSRNEYVKGSGNVFADLGLDDADELLARAQLGHSVRQILEQQGLSQCEISAKLGIGQAEVSKLMNGHYHLFSEKRWFGFLDKLDKQVIMKVVDRPEGEPVAKVIL